MDDQGKQTRLLDTGHTRAPERTRSPAPQPLVALAIGPDLKSRSQIQWDFKPPKQILFYAVLPLFLLIAADRRPQDSALGKTLQ